MGRHALVIGSQTQGLEGAVHDATCMAQVLAGHEFEVDLRIDLQRDGNASRQGILDGYDALIRKAKPADAAVVYYAGHGAFALNQDPADRIRTMQAIVPTDVVPGSPSFRGITSWELGIKLAQLTARTRNVTVILDCCHASQMSRDGAARQAVPRALPHPLHVSFRAHLDELEQIYGKVELDPVGNPHAVRLTACAQHESAFEYLSAAGPKTLRVGAFTEALIAVLTEIGKAPISWMAIGDAVRERVLRRFPAQRPAVEGPSHRQVFALTTDDRTGIVPVTLVGDELRIDTGEILGTSEGDVYAAMPFGSKTYDEAGAIARLRVTRTAAMFSTVTPEWKNGKTRLPEHAVAIPIELTAPRYPVTLIVPDAERAAIVEAIASSLTLRIATAGETSAALATLRLADHQLTIEDPAGPIFPPAHFPAELTATVKNLANLGVARRIRSLVGEHGLSSHKLEISWGVVENGQMRPMPDQGASLGLGDRIYVKVRNTGGDPRYVHIFNVGVRGKVTLLTKSAAPAGYRLNNNISELVLGERNGKLAGLPLSWPKGLSERSFPRTDSLFVFVTAQPVDLHHLETQEHAVRGARRAAGSKLQQLLAQVQDGVTRDVRDDAPIEDFLVKQLSYELHPRTAAMADTVAFQIDENQHGHAAGRSPDAWITGGEPPERTAGPLVPRGGGAAAPAGHAAPPAPSARALESARGGPVMRDEGAMPPAPAAARERAAVAPVAAIDAPDTISIRLGELVVERNRALFSADIRIDALICTRSPNQPETYAAHTMRFQGIEDGERLPLDNARLFHGPVRDFVDICLWVSRDTTRDRDLAELFSRHANSPQLHDAATALLATAQVAAAPWIAAVGASAALARIAYDLILAVESRTIGLYRTSFLAGERFGVGRHPTEGLYRAQDFSFSLLVEPVTPPTN